MTGEFFLDDTFDVISRHILVLHEDLSELLVASRNENRIEDGFVSSPLTFTGFEQCLYLFWILIIVILMTQK